MKNKLSILAIFLITLLGILVACSNGEIEQQKIQPKSGSNELSPSPIKVKEEVYPFNSQSDLLIDDNGVINGVKNKDLAKSFIIPSNVTSIKKESFSYCNNLEWLYIPSSVTTIEEESFYKCTLLSFLVINSPNIDIKDNAFLDCYSLSHIYCIGNQRKYFSLFDMDRSDIAKDIVYCYSDMDELPFKLI